MPTIAIDVFKRMSQLVVKGIRLPFRSSLGIGLDIGSHAIKLVRLKKQANGWQLDRIRIEDIPELIRSQDEKSMDSALETSLSQMVEEEGLKGLPTAISISGPSVMVKPIQVPAMTEEEVAGHLEWEIERYLPYEAQDIYWDYYVPQMNALNQRSVMTVFLVAAKKETVDTKFQLVRQVGLQPTVVDIDSFALSNMYRINYPERGQEAVLLVNLGPSGLHMTALDGSERLSTRDTVIGGEWYQDVLQEGIRLPRESLKQREASGHRPEALDVLLEEVYEEVGKEVQNMVENFSDSEHGGQPIQRVMLCGGYSGLSGLTEHLHGRLSLAVEMINPLRKLTHASHNHDHSSWKQKAHLAGVAVGLAMRSGGTRS